ncbi:MAG: hypothetical protein ACKUBY_03995 [Candidatus Moraniibacteriota bacterium]|jgi:hypothetical protein
MQPYVGITDFMDVKEVVAMAKVFNSHEPGNFQYKLHVGVMMSYKTLHGWPTKWTDAFPRNEVIASIFDGDYADDVMYCLHYADSKKRPELWKSLRLAIIYGGKYMHALQLDLVWPDRHQIFAAITDSGIHPEIILQIGKQAFEEIDNNPRALVDRLGKYAYDEVLHRVLLDKSMGRGIGMDAPSLIPFIEAIQNDLPDIGISIAGGLGPETYQLSEPVMQSHNNISVDAQGKLRESGNALDPVNWDMAGQYLIKMINMIDKYQ